ncbi:hypothetical protein F5Y15DRAFT_202018 [Xylariaceae sp. FL0016]|nr:hypothetical protein F5Y15DRAFT_202018 [Xylariaceae sp. FL0016]
MAGAKKKKTKPAANPARGFATTSVVSKPRVDNPTPEPRDAPTHSSVAANSGTVPDDPTNISTDLKDTSRQHARDKQEMSPEEFEQQLEESELQLLVEKHAAKVKRDAQRQKTRLDSDRRLLRSQAEALNTRKWLPQELMDHIFHLLHAETRFTASSSHAASNSPSASKLPAEEDLTMRLWTLQQTLSSASFPQHRVQSVIQYVLDIAPSVNHANKDSTIWGLEEALDWLAMESSDDELRDYDFRSTPAKPVDMPLDSPLTSGANTPRALKNGHATTRSSQAASPKKLTVTCDEDIEPDQLIPVYLETKTKLFHVQRPRQDKKKSMTTKKLLLNEDSHDLSTGSPEDNLEEAKLSARIERIEQDVLFDKPLAEHQWRAYRIVLEKEFAASKQAGAGKAQAEPDVAPSDNGITEEAERMAAGLLQQEDNDEDQSLSDLFASLPVQETDASGKTITTVNGADGIKVTIRSFGNWTGISPVRALEEACRSRYESLALRRKFHDDGLTDSS